MPKNQILTKIFTLIALNICICMEYLMSNRIHPVLSHQHGVETHPSADKKMSKSAHTIQHLALCATLTQLTAIY